MAIKSNIKDFITKANEIHNNKYDYSQSVYINAKTKLEIICKDHGVFELIPDVHINIKRGCPKCMSIEVQNNRLNKIVEDKFKGIIQPEEYKVIPIGLGLVVMVDNEDFDFLSRYSWSSSNKKVYARNGSLGTMHRFLLNCPKDKQVDHIDGNPLNNRKSNLRICDSGQNTMNQKPQKGKSSIYKGVCWDKRYSKWVANITKERKTKFLGYFYSEVEAATAYNIEALKLHGEYSRLNDI